MMSIERRVSLLFRANAIINWTVSLPGLIDPVAAAAAFGGAPPNYPAVIRLWQGFVFMFGCMFWEASCDVRASGRIGQSAPECRASWTEHEQSTVKAAMGRRGWKPRSQPP